MRFSTVFRRFWKSNAADHLALTVLLAGAVLTWVTYRYARSASEEAVETHLAVDAANYLDQIGDLLDREAAELLSVRRAWERTARKEAAEFEELLRETNLSSAEERVFGWIALPALTAEEDRDASGAARKAAAATKPAESRRTSDDAGVRRWGETLAPRFALSRNGWAAMSPIAVNDELRMRFERARDAAQAFCIPPTAVWGERASPEIVVLAVPAYEGGGAGKSVEYRRKTVQGVLFVSFHVRKIFVISPPGAVGASVLVQLEAEWQPGRFHVVCRQGGVGASAPSRVSAEGVERVQQTLQFGFAGTMWRMTIRAGDAYVAHHRTNTERFVPWIGGLVTCVIAAYVRMMVAHRLVYEREAAVRATESGYRRFFDSSHECLMIYEPGTGRVLDANPAALVRFGFGREEIRRCTVADIGLSVGGTGRHEAIALIDKAFSEGPQVCEWKGHDRMGGRFRLDVTLIRSSHAGCECVFAMARDVTERRRAEDLSRLLRFALDHIPDEISWIADEGRLSYVNQAMCDHLGYSREELASMTIYDVNPQARIQRWPLAVGDLKQLQRVQGETFHRRKDGTEYPVEAIGCYMEFDGREGCFIIARDITERKRAEEALRESVERIDQIAEQSRTFTWEVDANGLYTYFNHVVTLVLGYEPEELIGKKHFYDLHPEAGRDAFKAAVLEGIARKESFVNYENKMETKAGRLTWVSTNAIPVLDKDGNLIAYRGNDTDITERKRAEETLRESENRLQRQNEALLSLISQGTLFRADLQQAIAQITEASSALMGTERVSVWVYSEDCSSVRCIDLYRRSDRRHTSGEVLQSAEFPAYIAGHREGQVVAAADVYADPRTCEIPVAYYREHGIRSLLDAPVWMRDRLGAILSFEHVGEQRTWTVEDERLAATMTALLSLCFEAAERKRAEEALEKEKIFNQTLVESSPAFFVAIGGDGRTIMMNNALLSALGYSKGEVEGRDYLTSFIPEEDRESLAEVFETLVRRHQSTVNENRILTKDGRSLLVEWHGQPVYREDGALDYFFGVGINITERKQVEEALRQSESRFRSIIAVSNTGAWEYHRSSDYLWCSPEYFSMLGHDPEGRVNLKETWLDLLHPDDREQADRHFVEYLRNGLAGLYENYFRMRHADGSWVWIWSRGQTLRNPDGSLSDVTVGTHINVTEKRLAEEALRQQKEQLTEVADMLPGVIYQFYARDDGAMGMYYVSRRAADLFGLADDAVDFFPSFSARVDERDRNEFFASIEKVVATQTPWNFEGRFAKPSGETIWFQGMSRPVRRGDELIFNGVLFDVTERKRAEAALRNSEERLRAVFNSVNDAIFEHDAQTGRVLNVNARMCEMYGYTKEEALACSVGDLSSNEPGYTQEDALHHLQEAADGRPQLIEWRARDKQGHFFWCEVSLRVAKIGEEDRVLVVARDITERKEGEAALRSSEERLRAVFDAVNDAIVEHDPVTGAILAVNRGMCEMFKCTRNQALQLDLRELSVDEPGYAREDAVRYIHEAAAGRPQLFEWKARDLQGRSFWCELTLRHAKIGDDDRVVAVARDITERKEVEAALRAGEQHLRAVFDSVSDMIFEHDPVTGKILDVNARTCEVFGFSKEEILSASIADLSSGEPGFTAEEGMRLIHEAAAGHSSMFEWRSRDRNGRVFWCEAAIHCAHMEDGDRVVLVARDVTERKRVEQALRETMKYLDSIVQGSPVPMFVLDRNHNLVYWNAAMELYTGVKASEIVGTPDVWRGGFYDAPRPCMADLLFDPNPEEELQKWFPDRWSKSPLIANAYEGTGFFPKIRGGVWMHFTAAPILDADGNCIGAVETLEDITERRKAEQALRETMKYLDSIVQGSPVPMFVLDRNHNVSYWNAAMELYTGVKAPDIVGTQEIWKGGFYDAPRPCMADLLFDPNPETQLRKWYGDRWAKSAFIDNAYEVTGFFPKIRGGVWLHFTAASILDADGNCIGAVETLEDITARKRAEEERERLLEELRRYAMRLEKFHRLDVAILANMDLHLLADETIAQVRTLVPCDRASVVSFDFVDETWTIIGLFAKSQPLVAVGEKYPFSHATFFASLSKNRPYLVRDLAALESPAPVEKRFIAEGMRSYVTMPCHSGTVLRGAMTFCSQSPDAFTAEHLEIIAQAATSLALFLEQSQLRMDRENLLSEVSQKNTELESLVYVASHDLRSPLVNIQGFSQRLDKVCEELISRLRAEDVPGALRESVETSLTERIPSSLRFIMASAAKMDQLISGLLRFSRTGRAVLRIEPLDMRAMIDAILATMTFQLQESGTKVHVEPLPWCRGDAGLLNQVFTNLLDNAVKYRDPARPLRIEISGFVERDKAVYRIADTGRGIAAGHQPKIWELFHRLDPQGGVAGEGLGLTMARRIVERHGGTIWIESELGKGSCFFVKLPANPTIENDHLPTEVAEEDASDSQSD